MIKRLAFILLVLTLTVLYSFYQKSSIESNLSLDSSSSSLLTKLPLSPFFDLNNQEFSVLKNHSPSDGLIVVHFWGTWCAPCEAELPDLVTFIKGFNGSSEVKFYLVAVNDDLLKVKKKLSFFNGLGATWLLDNNNVYKDKFGSTRVPETYVFSSEGIFIKKFLGPQEWTKDLYKQIFQEFLQTTLHKL